MRAVKQFGADTATALAAALDHENLLNKHTLAVDQDIEPENIEQVLWVLTTRYHAYHEGLGIRPQAPGAITARFAQPRSVSIPP